MKWDEILNNDDVNSSYKKSIEMLSNIFMRLVFLLELFLERIKGNINLG